MRPSIRILLIALPLLATGCDSLFYVEAETEEVCKTQRDIDFPASIPIPGTVSQTVEFPISDITATLPSGGTEAELSVHLFELTTADPNVDLNGIDRAFVSIRLPSRSQPTVVLEYKRPASQTSTKKLTATGSGTVDINELLRQDHLELTFEATGVLPQRDWKGDLRVCAGLRLRANVLDLIF